MSGYTSAISVHRSTGYRSFLPANAAAGRVSFLPVAGYNYISSREAAVSTRSDDPNAPYFPERYRQQVRAKKQRRFNKKVIAACAVFVVLAAAYILLSGMIMSSPDNTSLPEPAAPSPSPGALTPEVVMNVTVTMTPDYAMGTGISTLRSSGMLPADSAISFLRQDFPSPAYTLTSVNLTDRYTGYTLYEFRIRPADNLSDEAGFTVFEDALNGEPYTPGEENARITAGQAKVLAGYAFFRLSPDRVRVRYSTSPETGRAWAFVLVKNTTTILTGSLDTDTGRLLSFTRFIDTAGRPSGPVLDMPAAQEIADRFIADQNGPVAVSTGGGQYLPRGSPEVPVAGQYIFVYKRTVQDIPCDEEGFTVGIDAVTGEVTGYERHWSVPDNAFSVLSDPLVLKRDASFAVLQRARETLPAPVSGLRVVSAELLWKDQHPPGVIPRPGSIPLAYKVQFDDDSIRADSSAVPAVGWVDSQTGSILEFRYRH